MSKKTSTTNAQLPAVKPIKELYREVEAFRKQQAAQVRLDSGRTPHQLPSTPAQRRTAGCT